MPGDPLLPQHYYQARRGKFTFLFRIPIQASSPSSISFVSGLAKVRYELRASVGVYWKNEKKLVVDNKTVDVVEAFPYGESLNGPSEAIVVGDNGKLWMQGRMIGGAMVAGGSACLELQVKNHSNKKNSNLYLTLTRTLYLPGQQPQQQPATIQFSDTPTTVTIPRSRVTEGVANLVFDVPKYARGVRGGVLEKETEAILGDFSRSGVKKSNWVWVLADIESLFMWFIPSLFHSSRYQPRSCNVITPIIRPYRKLTVNTVG